MKSLILWSVRLTYTRKGKNPSGLDLAYCNTQALSLLACLCGPYQTIGLWILTTKRTKQTMQYHQAGWLILGKWHNTQWPKSSTVCRSSNCGVCQGWSGQRSKTWHCFSDYFTPKASLSPAMELDGGFTPLLHLFAYLFVSRISQGRAD